MNAEMPSLSLFQSPVQAREESMLCTKVDFKFLESKLGDHGHHDPHVRGVINSKSGN
jgi:hypothetical protein